MADPARLRPRLWSRGRSGGTWTVHATVDEPTELLCAFVAHYKALGADVIWLALDQPRADQVAILGSIPGVRLTLCTRAYWLGLRGYRPRLHVSRQYANANRAYRQTATDWFLECDADEFLVPDHPLSDLLTAIPAEEQFLRFAMAERIFVRDQPPASVFDGVFRTAMRHRPGLIARVYGDLAPMIPAGMTGHVIGKSITRTGLRARLWIHHPVPPWSKPSDPAVRAMVQAARISDAARVFHFDGMTPFHWRLKLLRKLLVGRGPVDQALKHNTRKRGQGRAAQIDALFAARTDPAALAALDGLQILPPAAIAQLAKAGTIIDTCPDLARQACDLFPDQGLDFSVAHFDQRLATLYADSIARLGLGPVGPERLRPTTGKE
jgi:hypothetical protein